jgi:hypothetical protein
MKTLTVYHFQGHDSLSLAVFNGIVLWGATDQTGTGYRVPLAFESDIRSDENRSQPLLLREIKKRDVVPRIAIQDNYEKNFFLAA